MSLEEIYSPVRSELEALEEGLLGFSNSESPEISGAVCDVLRAGGKRLRPALLLLAAKACGYSGERAVRLAAAVELVHTASLIHDDVIDGAQLRRGVATMNSRWGSKVSVLVGDHLYAKVVGILAEDGDPAVMRSVSVAAARMAESEMTQTLCQNDVTVTEERYLSIIAGKTASLISCSCRIGAMLQEDLNGQIDALTHYGQNLGMAFQITDDLLDLTGEEGKLGKAPGNDIREGRLTLPFIRALSVADDADRKRIAQAFSSGRADDDDLKGIRDAVRRSEGIEYSLEKARDYGRACRNGLASVAESESRACLALLVDHVVGRAC